MATKDSNTAISVDSLVYKDLTGQTKNLITQIQEDIENEKQLSDRTCKSCTTILADSQKKYNRIQMAFIEETQILIQKAISDPSQKYHQTWMHIFDIYTSQCEQLTGPILQVLNSVAIESARLRDKYRHLVAGATSATVIATVLIGGLVMHFLPASICCFTLTAGGVGASIGAAIVVAGLAIAFVSGAIKTETIRTTYDRCTSEIKLLLAKSFPSLLNGKKNVITAHELNKTMREALNALKITKDVWLNLDTLEMLKRSAARELETLKENL